MHFFPSELERLRQYTSEPGCYLTRAKFAPICHVKNKSLFLQSKPVMHVSKIPAPPSQGHLQMEEKKMLIKTSVLLCVNNHISAVRVLKSWWKVHLSLMAQSTLSQFYKMGWKGLPASEIRFTEVNLTSQKSINGDHLKMNSSSAPASVFNTLNSFVLALILFISDQKQNPNQMREI